MKNISQETLARRLSMYLNTPLDDDGTKPTKESVEVKLVEDLIKGTNKTGMIIGTRVRPCITSGYGGSTKNLNYTTQISTLLGELGLQHVKGNDSPRGTLSGNYIFINTKVIR